jgi:O-glycosyl hydrolase
MSSFFSLLVVLLLQTAAAAVTTRPAATAVTVHPGERQTFGGFGSSIANFNGHYEKLPPEFRQQLAKKVWTDLNFSILRLWMQTFEYSPEPGQRDLTVFRRQYIDSGIIADARKAGVKTLLLAPDNLPPYMRQTNADGTIQLRASEAKNYAILLADFITQLKKEHGLTIDVTGIQNEPSDEQAIKPSEMAEIVAQLRIELDERGVKQTKIIATENANTSSLFIDELKVLKAHPAAWNALAGIASHSYNMASTEEAGAFSVGKEYWMTEASEGGPELPNDTRRAAATAARFLNDVNHRVTHWIHFLAYENVRKDDNGTCILNFTNDPPAIEVLLKWHAFKMLSETFEVGARFRHCTSDTEGEMTWTYGQKPHITVAVAKNPDSSWAIGAVNFSADDFTKFNMWGDEKWKREQGGKTPAAWRTVQIDIAELRGQPPLKFVATYLQNDGSTERLDVSSQDGRLSFVISPMQVVTLRSK